MSRQPNTGFSYGWLGYAVAVMMGKLGGRGFWAGSIVLGVALCACVDGPGATTVNPVEGDAAAGQSLTVSLRVPEIPVWVRPEVETNIDGAVRVEAGDDLSQIVSDQPPGMTFVIAAGRHVAQSVTPRSGDVFLGERGAVLDGDFAEPYAITAHDLSTPVVDVVIRGITFERYDTPASLGTIGGGGGQDWLIEGNEVRLSRGGGIEIGTGSIVRNNFVHHNEQIGLHIGSPTTGILIEANEVSFNNVNEEYDPAWEAGGSKFVLSSNLTVRGNYVHDNGGAGLWTDGENVGTVYDGNFVIDNDGPGIFHEISYSAEITNNYIAGNAHEFYVGGILVANSSDVVVKGNTVIDNNGGVVAIEDDRGSGFLGKFTVKNLVVEDNLVRTSVGWTGILTNSDSFDIQDASNSFDGNRYTASSRGDSWFWGDQPISFARWRLLGLDPNGSADVQLEDE